MNRLANPFRYIAGGRALVMGLAFIFAESWWLHATGLCQNSYLHFAPATLPLWRTILRQLAFWLVPALLLYGCGRALSPSRIRLVDVLGTTALAQGPILLLIAPLALTTLRQRLDSLTGALLAGDTLPSAGALLPLLLFALYSLAALALFYVRNYQAYSVSCNLRGRRAVGSYIAVVLLVTLLSQSLPL